MGHGRRLLYHRLRPWPVARTHRKIRVGEPCGQSFLLCGVQRRWYRIEYAECLVGQSLGKALKPSRRGLWVGGHGLAARLLVRLLFFCAWLVKSEGRQSLGREELFGFDDFTTARTLFSTFSFLSHALYPNLTHGHFCLLRKTSVFKTPSDWKRRLLVDGACLPLAKGIAGLT